MIRRVTAVLITLAAGLSSTAGADQGGQVIAALAGDRACTFKTWDGGSDARGRHSRLLTIYDCGAAGYLAVLSAGPYPLADNARITDYRVLVRQRIVKPRGAQLDLVDGVCRIGRKAITGTGVLIANWRSRMIVSGTNITALWVMSADRSKLVRTPAKGMICEMDEP